MVSVNSFYLVMKVFVQFPHVYPLKSYSFMKVHFVAAVLDAFLVLHSHPHDVFAAPVRISDYQQKHYRYVNINTGCFY